ncbi:zinc finger transcription factor 1, partial [Moniliophthora roreri]
SKSTPRPDKSSILDAINHRFTILIPANPSLWNGSLHYDYRIRQTKLAKTWSSRTQGLAALRPSQTSSRDQIVPSDQNNYTYTSCLPGTIAMDVPNGKDWRKPVMPVTNQRGVVTVFHHVPTVFSPQRLAPIPTIMADPFLLQDQCIAEQPTHPQHQHQHQPYYPITTKRQRPESSDSNVVSHAVEQRSRPPMELDPALTRELTSLFFTHCHPCIAAIHKPSFANALALNQVPPHLLFAICALAARYSKQPSLRVIPGRHSGRQFADEAARLMFEDQDAVGRLLVPPTLQTAQTLLILSIYEILAADVKHDKGKSISLEQVGEQASWARGERYRDLTLQILQSLGVHTPDHPLLTPVPSQSYIETSIERESVRRIFWIIYIIDLMRGIYYRWDSERLGGSGRGYGSSVFDFTGPASTPRQAAPGIPPIMPEPCTTALGLHQGVMGYREDELKLRLPADETSFELGAVHESLPEYLYLAPIRTPYASELGHVLRVMTIHQRIEAALAELVALSPSLSQSSSSLSFQNDQNDPFLTSQSPSNLNINNASSNVRPITSAGRLGPLTAPSETSQTSTSIVPNEVQYAQTETLPTLTFQFNNKRRAEAIRILSECSRALDEWSTYLPPQLQFTETNLNVQRSMFETSSNTSAWCFACVHALWASSALALAVAFRGIQVDLQGAWGMDGGRTRPIFDNDVSRGEPASVRNGDDLGWAIDRLHVVLDLVGERRRSSMMLGVVIWPMIKYLHRDDPQLKKWVDEYADFCGAKMTEVTGARWGTMPPPSEAVDEKQPPSETSNTSSHTYQATTASTLASSTSTVATLKAFPPGINHIITGSSSNSNHRAFSNMELMNGVQGYGLDRGADSGPTLSKSGSDNISGAVPDLQRHVQPPTTHSLASTLQSTSLPSLKSSGLLEWQAHHPSGQPALMLQTMVPAAGSGVSGSNIPLQNSHTPPIQQPSSPVDSTQNQNRLRMSWLLNDG